MSEIWAFIGGVGVGMIISASVISWGRFIQRGQPCGCSDCRDVWGGPV